MADLSAQFHLAGKLLILMGVGILLKKKGILTEAGKRQRKEGLPPKDFQGIRQFMANISRSGMDYAVKQAGSKYLASKYINQLTSLGICPIPIPQNARTPFLENPFREFYERDCR